MNLKNHESISESVTLASVRATYAYEQYDKLMGITQYESIILYELFTHPRLSQKELVYRSGIPKQSISKGIHNLAELGYLEISSADQDKRVKYCALTESGLAYAREKEGEILAIEKKVIDKLGFDRAALACQILDEWSDLLSKEIANLKEEKQK
ncbi:MarR family winged helix-turn-helix transcriptional regulator [Lactobacillus delbrueckii]|jgi:DNA-binding MarR family transcriptional regulator|uniref:MarR family winged helix-turn-helix transcriptional regulator n=2 Tax=Lactobacillus delbrueckii TaxID=1584 RepID=UPI0003312225|nr:MarR family transcriptional regulator [Lactobacillus delbrueckii]APG73319.1 MarR family transcriptional regulator [Lactobacillus delbrueckii subsp. jakobsenii ZN7a-9 = DSM 26046]APG74726.1 MarR family transcriptional regulator [Lactobacillus delbrueckii subsp. sunkii]ARR36755.1 MarR family transcriptional regulator [Lactobacillus delbrueckii subsp. delbrueckii]EOD02929.1 transcriptional regulator [Lactobacillus delbrueckii subsp. jakobsenii ZN7a-9 = DSM 26046]KNE74170.1 MarR family transcri